MSTPELLQGLTEFESQEARQAEELRMGDHDAPHREARGTAASLKRDAINDAALETKEKTAAPVDVTINHEE